MATFLKVLNRGQPDEYYQLTNDLSDIVEDLETPSPTGEYWALRSTPGTIALNKCMLKGGPRAKTREYEIVEVEAGGVVVGSAESLI